MDWNNKVGELPILRHEHRVALNMLLDNLTFMLVTFKTVYILYMLLDNLTVYILYMPTRGLRTDTAMMDMNGQGHFSTTMRETYAMNILQPIWMIYSELGHSHSCLIFGNYLPNLCSQPAAMNQCCSLFWAN